MGIHSEKVVSAQVPFSLSELRKRFDSTYRRILSLQRILTLLGPLHKSTILTKPCHLSSAAHRGSLGDSAVRMSHNPLYCLELFEQFFFLGSFNLFRCSVVQICSKSNSTLLITPLPGGIAMQLPLDLDDSSLSLPPDQLEAKVNLLDAEGWNRTLSLHGSAITRGAAAV
jgi:hypothetical protein